MNDTLQGLLDAIAAKVNDLTTLEIKTLMGDMELKDQKVLFKDGQDMLGITSKIDLVDGDITTHISEEFYQKYPELVQWHQSREKQGNEIIRNNIATIKTLADTVSDMFSKKDDKPTT